MLYHIMDEFFLVSYILISDFKISIDGCIENGKALRKCKPFETSHKFVNQFVNFSGVRDMPEIDFNVICSNTTLSW